jgi:Transposase DDE domain
MQGIDVQVLLASGYAIFLAFVAAAFELAARHSHQRTRMISIVGFSYHSELDIWKCPNGKHLYRAEALESNAVRYRAQAHHCNSCPIKSRCTDSDEGRVIEVQADSWLQSELRKFHRGLSLTLLLLADLILVVAMLRQNNMREQLILVLLVLCISGAGFRIFSNFFRPVERNT